MSGNTLTADSKVEGNQTEQENILGSETKTRRNNEKPESVEKYSSQHSGHSGPGQGAEEGRWAWFKKHF